MEQVEEDVEAT